MVKKMLGVLFVLFVSAQAVYAEDKLVVYSARQEPLIKPLFDAYTAKTGVKIEFISDKEGPLFERLKAEGARSPADLLITVDAGNLWYGASQGLFAPVNSEVLTQNVPAHLRDPENRWFGLSVRARTIVYHSDKVQPGELSTYEALGAEAWKGRLCLRTSKKVYNQSLVAMLIADYGVDKAEAIVRAWVGNLAAEVFADDTLLIQAVEAGQCDAGIVNTYYYGRYQKEHPDTAVRIFWPNQDTSGVHVNVSGAGILKTSKNKTAAAAFLEWMSSPEAQNLFADSNQEYPVNPSVEPAADVQAWGSFKQNKASVAQAGELQLEAVKLMDRAGYR